MKVTVARMRAEEPTVLQSLDFVKSTALRVLQNRVRCFERRLHEEQCLRQTAELSLALFEDKLAFVEASTELVIKNLRQRVTELEDGFVSSCQKQRLEAHVEQPAQYEGEVVTGMDDLLRKREYQLDRAMTELNEVQKSLLKKQMELGTTYDALVRSRTQCNKLLMELYEQKRTTKALDIRLWEYERRLKLWMTMLVSQPNSVLNDDPHQSSSEEKTKGERKTDQASVSQDKLIREPLPFSETEKLSSYDGSVQDQTAVETTPLRSVEVNRDEAAEVASARWLHTAISTQGFPTSGDIVPEPITVEKLAAMIVEFRVQVESLDKQLSVCDAKTADRTHGL